TASPLSFPLSLHDALPISGLGLGSVVVLRVAGVDHELVLALGVDLLDADPGRRERRVVERGHLARLVEGPADDDRLLRRGSRVAPRGAGESGDCHDGRQRSRQDAPPRRTSHCTLLLSGNAVARAIQVPTGPWVNWVPTRPRGP